MSSIDNGAYHDAATGELQQVVLSPEQVALEFPVAGPTSRILAYGIDWILIVLLELGALLAVLLTTPLALWLSQQLEKLGRTVRTGGDPLADGSAVLYLVACLLLFQLVIESGYFVFFEMTLHGRSPGKAVVKLRVVRDGGLPIGVRESLVRNLLRAVDMLPQNYVVGLVAMLVSSEGKRLGDQAAGTIVVRLDRPEAPAPLPGTEGEDATRFRFRRDQIARLGSPERALLRETLRRLERLPPERAGATLERTVEALRTRIGYEPVPPPDRLAFLRGLYQASRRN